MNSRKLECKIIKHLGTLKNGKYPKEINLVSWNGKEPVYDIRYFKISENGTKEPLKGISISKEEITSLMDILEKINMENK